MAPSDLDAALRQRAAGAADAIMRAAKAEADRIAAEADRAIGERRSAVLSIRGDQFRAEARAGIAAERHEAMRAVLLSKTRVVERVLQRARELLPAGMGSDAYSASLEEEVARALAFVGGDETVVRCSERLAPALREALRANTDVAVEIADDVGSGFVIVGKVGHVRIDSTLETRLDQLAPVLAIEIHEQLEQS